MIELNSKHLYVEWILLYAALMSRTHFRVNSHSIFAWMLRNSLLVTLKRHHIWSLSDCNKTQTHNHVVRKWTLKHLAKLTKWLSWIVSTYLYGAFDWMLFLYHVSVLEWIHTLYSPECQGSRYSEQTPCLMFKLLQRASNLQPLIS